MYNKFAQFSGLLWLLILAQPGLASEKLNAGQVKNLFHGNTVEYHHEKLNMDFIVYHAPDGSLRGTRNGQPMNELQWSVNNQGELCISYNQHNRCHPIMLAGNTYKKYTVTKQGTIRTLVTYRRFIEGNPNDF